VEYRLQRAFNSDRKLEAGIEEAWQMEWRIIPGENERVVAENNRLRMERDLATAALIGLLRSF
jgi:hypothetical protein